MTEDLLFFLPPPPSFSQKCSIVKTQPKKTQPGIPGVAGLIRMALGGSLVSGQSGKEKLERKVSEMGHEQSWGFY